MDDEQQHAPPQRREFRFTFSDMLSTLVLLMVYLAASTPVMTSRTNIPIEDPARVIAIFGLCVVEAFGAAYLTFRYSSVHKSEPRVRLAVLFGFGLMFGLVGPWICAFAYIVKLCSTTHS